MCISHIVVSFFRRGSIHRSEPPVRSSECNTSVLASYYPDIALNSASASQVPRLVESAASLTMTSGRTLLFVLVAFTTAKIAKIYRVVHLCREFYSCGAIRNLSSHCLAHNAKRSQWSVYIVSIAHKPVRLKTNKRALRYQLKISSCTLPTSKLKIMRDVAFFSCNEIIRPTSTIFLPNAVSCWLLFHV